MMAQAEVERNKSFVKELVVANEEEVGRKSAQHSTRHLIRLDLEAQMREKAVVSSNDDKRPGNVATICASADVDM